jgi:hypothetical protein
MSALRWLGAGLMVAALGLPGFAAPGGPVLFRETFDRCEEGKPPPAPWQVLEGQALVENGSLHITSQKQNPRVLLRQQFSGDISVTLRLRKAPGCHWSGMAVKGVYWLTVNQQYTSLLLDRRLDRVPSGIAPEEVGKRLAGVPNWGAYLWDPQDFVMRLDCQGKTLRAYLDGKRFIEVCDDFMPDRGALMLVGGWGTDIIVDDVTVTRFIPDMTPPEMSPPPQPSLEELKPTLDRQDAIYSDGETAKLSVCWRATESRPLRLRLTLIDFYERTVAAVETKAEQEAGKQAQAAVALTPPRRGIFKVAMSTIGAGERETPQGDLISFSVLPKHLADRTESQDSYFGGHPHWEVPEFHSALARKIGVRWARDHDAIQYTWWPKVEPERGQWHWYDEEIGLLRRNHLHLLGEFLYVPPWAATDGSATKPPKNLNDFAAYVRETVAHYRDTIRFWEVWNEPHFGGFWEGTPEQYADLLRVAYEAAKAANPDCVVIGGGGVALDYLNWVERVLRAGALRHCDRFSFHYGYAGKALESERQSFLGRLQRLRELMRQNGGEKPLWNTEAAVMTTSFLDPYRQGYAEPDAIYHFREAAYAVVRMVVLNIACGVQKIFYYDILWPRRDVFIEGFLKNPVNTGMLELHGGLKPLGVAYATTADILDGARFVATVELAPEVHAYLFASGNRCVAVYWGNFGRKWVEKRIRLQRQGRWELRDIMNVRTTLPFQQTLCLSLTRAPIFVIATGTRMIDFQRAWRNGRVEQP